MKKANFDWMKNMNNETLKHEDFIVKDLHGKLISQLEEKIIEGLKRKGFEFENKFELEEFVKANCRCEDNIDFKEKIYFVKDMPFFYWKYETKIDMPIITTERETKISATYGEFAFL